MALASVPFANADSLTLKGYAQDGSEKGSAAITTQSSVTFTADGVSVNDAEGKSIALFSYPGLDRLEFSKGGSGISFIGTDTTPLLKNNPVGDNLEFTSGPAAPTALQVSDLSGKVCLSIRDWNGENVEVSSLPAGIYMVSFNNLTSKFIKK